MHRVHTLIATVLLLCVTITAGFGFISLFHSGHHADTSLSCPFSNHVERTCSNTILGHFEAWSHTFLLIFALTLVFIPLRRLVLARTLSISYSPPQRPIQADTVPSPLQWAFSRGILNTKAY
jgi:hypothetical protein